MKQTLSLLLLAVFLLLVVPLRAQQEEQWKWQRFPAQLDTSLILSAVDLNKVIQPVAPRKKQRAMRRLYDSPYVRFQMDSVSGEEKYEWLGDIEQYSISVIKESDEPDYVFLTDMNGDGRKDIIMNGPGGFCIFYRDKWRPTYHSGSIFPHAEVITLEFNRLDRRTQSLKRLCLREYNGEDRYLFTSYTSSGYDKEFSRDSTYSVSYVGDDLLGIPFPLRRQAYVEISEHDSLRLMNAPPAQFPQDHKSIYYGAVYAKDFSNGSEEWLVLDEFHRLRWHDARKLRK